MLFSPRAVAVIGATDSADSNGRTVLWNLVSNPFGGTVYAVNPKRHSVLGIKAYPDLASLPEPIDLAVIVSPAHEVPTIIQDCAAAKVGAAIIMSSGFAECGHEGARLQEAMMKEARRGGVRVLGPSSFGVMCPPAGISASVAAAPARAGSVGFISQSAALCASILDWSFRASLGFSAFVSVGAMADIAWGDLIYHLGDDPATQSIVIYMETIGDARAFLSAAREVALSKPIIVLKAGRTEAAVQSAISHTGALAESDEVTSAAFRRSGVLRVDDMESLFYMAEVLGKQPSPRGPRLTVITNAGGPGVLATDALIAGGGKIAELEKETVAAMDELLPPRWMRRNPVNLQADATPERYSQTLALALEDENTDGVLLILTPRTATDPTKTAEAIRECAGLGRKPVLASWMGGADVAFGASLLSDAGIPTFSYPDTAARVFNYMWRYSYNLRGIYETPALAASRHETEPDHGRVESMIQFALEGGRDALAEHDSKELLSAYGVPVVETQAARSVHDALVAADDIGYPVVLKLCSDTIAHKSDVGGVQLNLNDGDAVRRAFDTIETNVGERAGEEHFQGVTVQPMIQANGYEVILGSAIDPQFGPVLIFGAGGQLVEYMRDRALALPPLNSTLARRMMEQTSIFRAIQAGWGGAAIDIARLEELLVRFSYLVAEQRWISSVDINPLLVGPDRLIALDAVVALHPRDTRASGFPRLAIRPYPSEYVSSCTLKNGDTVTLRPIRPEDEPLMVRFHQTLSNDTVYYRYLGLLALDERIRHERLVRLCFIDYDRELALVAQQEDPESGERAILGIGRIIRMHGSDDADFAVVISDARQGLGLGTHLLKRMIEVARSEGIARLHGDVLPENRAMLALCARLGFREHRRERETVTVEMTL